MVPVPELRSGPGRARALAVLAAVVLALAGVVSRPAHAAAKASVTVKNYTYSVPDLVIDPGTEVTWTATQGDHTVTSEGGSFDELIAADYAPHSFTYTFTKPGKYTYYCGFHRAKGMEAVVEVRGAPGETTTTEPPTTTTTWSPPTTTTSAPATTTTAPPVTATTAAPTTTSAPVPTSTSTVPVTTRAAPSTTAPAAPPTSARPAQAGPAKGPAAAPATSTSTAATPPPAAVTSTAPAPPPAAQPPAGDTTPPRSLNLAARAPVQHRRSDTAAAETANGDRSLPVLALLLGAVGLLAAAGMGAGVWRRRR